MATRTGKLFRLVVGLIIIAAAAVLAAPLVSVPRLRTAAEGRLSRTMGRQVTVGSASLSMVEGPSLLLKDVVAKEDPHFGDGVFLKANEVRAGIDPDQFIHTRHMVIDSLRLKSAEIALVRGADGAWNWTTFGRKSSSPANSTGANAIVARAVIDGFVSFFSLLSPGVLPTAVNGIRSVSVENGTVRLIDLTRSNSAEAVYKNITLNASLEPQPSANAKNAFRATGKVTAKSGADDTESDVLDVDLPFDLLISELPSLTVSGSVGPGSLETKNLKVGDLTLSGDLQAQSEKPLTAKGELKGTDLFINSVNLSEQVSHAIRVDQIGDMSPGTSIASLSAAFQIDKGIINTTNLRIGQLDGLGDAAADTGSFQIDSSLMMNYAATVTLSPDATSRLKSAGPMLGLLTTLLETNNRLSLPISISGDLRQPQVQVDVTRIF